MSAISASDLQERVEEMRRNSETPVRGAELDFGQRLKTATKRRVAAFQGSPINAHVQASDDFAEQLKQATKQRGASRSPTKQPPVSDKQKADRRQLLIAKPQ